MRLLNTSILIVSFLFTTCATQEKIQWLSWFEGEAIMKSNDLPYLVWIYDPNCDTCHDAEERIFVGENIEKLSSNYNAIKLSVQTKITIESRGKTFSYDKEKGHHELVLALTNATTTMSYPQIVFLDKEMNIIVALSGNIKEQEMSVLLDFVAAQKYKEMTIEEFQNNSGI